MSLRTSRSSVLAALVLGACLVLLGLEVARRQGSSEEQKLPTADAYGDPLPTGARARLGTLRLHTAGIPDRVALSHDGKLVASLAGEVAVWDVDTGAKRFAVPRGQRSIADVIFADGGMALITGCVDGSFQVWDTATGTLVRQTPPGTTMEKRRILFPGPSASFAGGGRWFVSRLESPKAEVCVRDVSTEQLLRRWPSDNSDLYVCPTVSEDGCQFLTAKQDKVQG
jgi:WD40 repeat protein